VEQESASRRRVKLWIFGLISFSLFVLLILLQSSNLWKALVIETATDTLLLYALSSLNFIAFIIFAFIFIRNLLKLARERKELQLGSQIKSRLLLYFFAVSLMPIIAMACFSYLFMNRAIERWFTNIPENVVRSAQQMQQEANQVRLSHFMQMARFLAFMLENQKIDDRKLSEVSSEAGLERVIILSKDGQVIAQSSSSVLNEYDNLPAEGEIATLKDGRLVTLFKLPDGRKLIVFSGSYPNSQSSKMAEKALEEFDRLKSRQVIVRQIGLSTLGLLTLLLIFASGWIAFHLSRGLTVPIKALAEGANEIAKGNLSHRVSAFAEDELALLVSSFNQMAERLQLSSSELRKGKEYIETVLESLSTGVISLDAENRLTTINRAATKMLRLDDSKIIGGKLSEILSVENLMTFENILKRARKLGKASEQTILFRQSDDQNQISSVLPVALTATMLPENSGVVIVIEDLTELISAQRAAAWSEVARRMAHEIKNPLTPIQLSAERIARKFETLVAEENDEKLTSLKKVITDGTEIILSEVKSLKSMVDEFSKFARLPNAKLEIANLNDVVRRTLLLYEDRSAEISIKLELLDHLPDCMLDVEQMKQVLVNLIDNAIEAFEPDQKNKEIRIRTNFDQKEAKIILEVSDNAVGINPEHFPKLFQPYFSTKNGGTGLGLAIVQRIITEHSGKISVAKNYPRGTKFRIELTPA